MSFTSWNDFWDDYKKIKAGYTKTERSQRKNIFFSGVIRASNSKSNPKQSVVKMISNLPRTSIKRCIDYTLKNAEDHLAFNEKGERVGSDEIIKEWSDDFGKNKNSKDVWHMIFSIKEPCTEEKLKVLNDSVRDVMKNNFFGYKYVFVIHTHQNNPHAHVVINKRNFITNKKIHFNSKDEIKDFFSDVRDDFSHALNVRGLNYANNNSLKKDLQKEFNKIKSHSKLDYDEYDTRDKINYFYENLEEKNKQKYKNSESKIQAMISEYNEFKKQNEELLKLFLQFTKKQNKKAYKYAKLLKENNKILRVKSKALSDEFKKLKKVEFNLNRLNDIKITHIKDRSDSLKMLENFTYNYSKLYPKHKGSSISDFMNYKKAKRAIAVLRNKNSDESIKFFNDSILFSRMLGGANNLHKFKDKIDLIDKNFYLIKNSDLSVEDKTAFEKRLTDNKKFILEHCEDRFKYVQNALLKGNKNKFLVGEYFKGLKILDKKSEPTLAYLELKNERKTIKKKQVTINKNKGFEQ